MKLHRPAALAPSGRRQQSHRRPTHPLRDATAEALEPRRLLSFSAAGPEFLATGVIAGDQYRPAVASNASGDFVVVFENGPPGPSPDIFAHRFAGGDGESLGGDFRVNSSINGLERYEPDVAMDPDGDFVVTWSVYNGGGGSDKSDVYARRFDAAGHPQGDEFRVNQTIAGHQAESAVGIDAEGDFVVTWASNYHIYARRYAADGTPLGNEFPVSVNGSVDQDEVSVSMDAAGGFAIVWRSMNQDPDKSHGIYGRRYDRNGKSLPVPAGVPVGSGGEFRVNTTIAGDQMFPDVAMDMKGDFAIVWTSNPKNPSGGNALNGGGIFLQRYTPAGTLVGGETHVNNLGATYNSYQSSVAMDAEGDFIVSYSSTFRYGDAPPYVYSSHVMSKRYGADGTELPPAEGVLPAGSGNEFRADEHPSGAGGLLDVTRDAAGDAVVVWVEYGTAGTGSTFDVWGRRFDDSTDVAGPIVSGLSAPGTPVFAGRPVVHPVTELVVDFSEALDTGGAGTSGPASLSNYRLTGDGGGDVSSLITGVRFAFNPKTGKFEANLALSAPLPDGSYVLTVRQAITDLAGNALDGNLDGTPGGGDASIAFVVHFIPPPVLQSITINNGSAQRSQVMSLTLSFDQPVSLAAGAARLDLLNTGGSGANDGSVPTDASSALAAPPTSPDGGKTWIFGFRANSAFVQKTAAGTSTGSLSDGIYQLSVDPTKVTVTGVAMAAAPAPFTFHRLFGDIDGNGSVNNLDYGSFRNAFGTTITQPRFNTAFDFDNNGTINTADFAQFRNRFGKAFTL